MENKEVLFLMFAVWFRNREFLSVAGCWVVNIRNHCSPPCPQDLSFSPQTRVRTVITLPLFYHWVILSSDDVATYLVSEWGCLKVSRFGLRLRFIWLGQMDWVRFLSICFHQVCSHLQTDIFSRNEAAFSLLILWLVHTNEFSEFIIALLKGCLWQWWTVLGKTLSMVYPSSCSILAGICSSSGLWMDENP